MALGQFAGLLMLDVEKQRTSNSSSTLSRLNALFAAQHSCATTAQLIDAGLGPGSIRSWWSIGRLRRLYRGVYTMAVGELSDKQRCMAAALAAGDDGAVSHLAAAVIRGVWKRSRLATIDVVSGRRLAIPGLRCHHCHDWNAARDIRRAAGIGLTTAERMVIDLGSSLTRYQITNVVKESAFQRMFDLGRFHVELERAGARTGVPTARRAVVSYEAGCAGTRSALEDRAIKLLHIARLPLPDEAGVPIGPHEVDLVWFDRNLIVEIDGPGHRMPGSRRKDPARDADLRAAGFEVLRFTDHNVDRDPYGMISRLASCFR